MARPAEARAAAARFRATVEEVRGRAAFAGLREAWDDLVARGPVDVPFARHAWISAWLDAFAPAAEPLALVARGPGGAALGMALFLRGRALGLPALLSPVNDHSSRFEWALGPDPGSAVAAIWAHLRDRLAWSVLLLREVPRDGPTSALLEPLARADGHLTGRWSSVQSPRLALGGAPALERTRSHFRANLRRRERRLLELGAVALRRVGAPDEVEGALEDFLAVEASGWKGRAGTAVARDPALVRFYRAIAQDAARRGALAIRALTLDGRPVAVHLGVVHRGVYHLPKTAYDEALAHVSPGQLLQREVLAECEARGLAGFDFLGPDMAWKGDWEPERVPHDWLYVYRPALGPRLVHIVKHRLLPLVKEVLWKR